jgi:hypothetical protein
MALCGTFAAEHDINGYGAVQRVAHSPSQRAMMLRCISDVPE